MNATVEKIEDNQNKVTTTVPAETVDKAIKKVYKELANKYNFPGFRKGKAPRAVIDNALGAEVALAQATEDVINDAYPTVIEEQQLYPVGQPQFPDAAMVAPGEDFTFVFTVGAKPEVELTSYDALEIDMPPADATDAEIDDQIEYMTRHFETYEDAADDAKLGADDFADLEVTATDADGNVIEPLNASKQFFSADGGLFNEAFDKEVLGIKKGEERTFTIDIPDDKDSLMLADMAGKTVTFDVKCESIKVKSRPELTDEWVKENLNFDTFEQLREEIKQSIQNQKDEIMPRIKENACKVALAERVDVDVPENMAEEAESELLQDFFTQLQQQGLTFDQYLASRGIDSDQFKLDVKRQAEDEAKEQLALDAWAKKFGITIDENDVLHEFEFAGVPDPKKTMEEWRKSGRLHLIREGVLRRKAMENAIEGAKVTIVDNREKAAEEAE